MNELEFVVERQLLSCTGLASSQSIASLAFAVTRGRSSMPLSQPKERGHGRPLMSPKKDRPKCVGWI